MEKKFIMKKTITFYKLFFCLISEITNYCLAKKQAIKTWAMRAKTVGKYRDLDALVLAAKELNKRKDIPVKARFNWSSKDRPVTFYATRKLTSSEDIRYKYLLDKSTIEMFYIANIELEKHLLPF